MLPKTKSFKKRETIDVAGAKVTVVREVHLIAFAGTLSGHARVWVESVQGTPTLQKENPPMESLPRELLP